MSICPLFYGFAKFGFYSYQLVQNGVSISGTIHRRPYPYRILENEVYFFMLLSIRFVNFLSAETISDPIASSGRDTV